MYSLLENTCMLRDMQIGTEHHPTYFFLASCPTNLQLEGYQLSLTDLYIIDDKIGSEQLPRGDT